MPVTAEVHIEPLCLKQPLCKHLLAHPHLPSQHLSVVVEEAPGGRW